MLKTRNFERQFKKLDQQKTNGLIRAAGRRLTLMGVLGIALGTLAIGMLLMAFEPIRTVLGGVMDVGQRIQQIILPDDELASRTQSVLTSNFQDQSVLGEASADITVENLQSSRRGDLFGWGQSTQTIDEAVASTRWIVYWQGAELTEDFGRITVHLPEAQYGGVWILADDLPMPRYDANWIAGIFDVFNGVDSPEAIANELADILNEEAAKHGDYLKLRAEAAAQRTIIELLREQGIEVHVVFGG